MSTQTPKQINVMDGWIPTRREHGGLRQVRRMKDGTLTFRGQEKGEEVKLVVRQHPLFLLRPGLPALGILLLLVIISSLFVRLPMFGPVWGLADAVLGVCFVIALGYFLWRDLLVWWVNIDIITNKRVISNRGFLQPSRKTITLDKIMQVSIDQESLLSIFLSYGNVHIYQSGGRHILKNVPQPREIRDALNGIHQEFKASRPVEKLPELVDPEMIALIGKLGKKEVLPKLPNADDSYAQWSNPEKLRKPLRRFGGPLRIPAEVTYAADEQTVMYIQRSKWLLVMRLFLPALALLAALMLTFIIQAIAIFTILAVLVLLAVIALIVINYVDDVFILTNRRIIDIERKYVIFYEARVEAEYRNIKDTKIKMTNILQNFLDVGSLYIETPGTNPDISMTLIDHPFFIADKINQIKGFKEKFDKAKGKNDRQEELVKWFTNVAAVLEKKIVSRGVPNLQTMDFWSAAAMAAEMGMKVIPVGEDDSYPQMEPGCVVSQEPLPGTLMAVDPASPDGRPQIQVILSKRS